MCPFYQFAKTVILVWLTVFALMCHAQKISPRAQHTIRLMPSVMYAMDVIQNVPCSDHLSALSTSQGALSGLWDAAKIRKNIPCYMVYQNSMVYINEYNIQMKIVNVPASFPILATGS